MSPKFITEKVAFSPMPYPEEIPRILESFDAVVVLTYKYELHYNINELIESGIEVLYAPIEDFSAPSLEELLAIVKWIDARVKKKKRVLIHCLGGSGRSGTIAAAYLMYSRALSLEEALRKVRSLKPSAVETVEQVKILKKFEEYLRRRG